MVLRHPCDAPKPGGPLTTRQPTEIQVDVGLPDATSEKSGRVSFVRGALPKYGTCIYLSQTIQYMQYISNIFNHMSNNASWAHKPILIKSIIITIIQLSPNNSIVDNNFVLYKHILKSTILIHVMSKNHQATNRLLQNQPQNELSPRALSVPEK